ncbi:MAG: hypothetical protein J1E01_07080 [Acetatifactor sp.]|nr:hypothetical protein [Acetatifactor sp.]
MLNEERVILMTHMASYESGEGKQNVKIGNYFRSDYIAVQVLKAVISATIAFALVFALYILYNLEIFLQDLYKIDIILFAKNVLTYYGITVVGYGILTYILSTYRYAKAKNNLKHYYQNLKKLNSLYNQQ